MGSLDLSALEGRSDMTPSAINRLDDAAQLEVQWSDGITATLLYRDLRLACG